MVLILIMCIYYSFHFIFNSLTRVKSFRATRFGLPLDGPQQTRQFIGDLESGGCMYFIFFFSSLHRAF